MGSVKEVSQFVERDQVDGWDGSESMDGKRESQWMEGKNVDRWKGKE